MSSPERRDMRSGANTMLQRTALMALVLGSALAGVVVPATAHPVHISSTQIDLATNRRFLEVTLRIFTDDLEEALYESTRRRVRFGQTATATLDSLLTTYVEARLKLLSGTSALPGKLLGHERENDATLVFVEVPLASVPTKMTVQNTVLLELFNDQSNIVHARFGERKRSALLRRGEERAVLSFE